MISVADRLKLVNTLRNEDAMSQGYRVRLFQYYTFLAEALEDENKMNTVRANEATFRVLCDKDMISVVKMLADTHQCKEACRKSKQLVEMFTGSRLAVDLNRVAGECTFDTSEIISLNEFNTAMKSFNNSASAEQTEEEILESIDADYEDGIEAYSEDEKALRDLIIGDNELAQSFGNEDKVPDIQFDNELLENMKAGNKDNSVIHEDINEYDNEVEDVELTYSELDEITDTIQAIVSRNEAVFRTCLELDRPYGLLYNKGLARCEIKDGKLKYIAGMGREGKSTFEILYNKLTSRYSNVLQCANDLRNTPTSENISQYGFTYYPGYVFQYAFGCISKQTFRNWSTFSKALKEEVTKRLKVLYKKDLFYDFKDRIEMAFTNSVLVIDYDRGGGMKIRMSLAGVAINCGLMERDIKTIPTYANATVNVRPVGEMVDVVDIQIIMNEKQFLSKPSWAYKAMEVKINSGEPMDLNAGIPIGRKVDGEIVNFTFNPSSDFVTLICAGSGAGKGVLTLSMLGAAIGNQLPVFYIDYKPDMAPVFWELEGQLGIHTFAIDGLTSKPRKDINGKMWEPGHNVPNGLKGIVKQYAGTLTYIKTLQLMCVMAQYRTDHGFESNMLFIFDEIQAAQKVIKAMMGTVYLEMKTCKPKAKEEPSDNYLYLKSIADLVKDTDTSFTTYLNTTGRASGIFSTFIGQSPNWDVWSSSAIQANGDYGKMDLFGQVTKAGTVRKLIGKGAGSSKYGLSTLSKTDPTGKRYVEENRFFGMYYGNSCEGVDVTVFKPFLTLNTDDIKHKCWTNGIGREYGYKSADPASFEKYRANVASVHPGDNQYGVHKGTGFLGLTGMYCSQDMDRIKAALEASYQYAVGFMKSTGLSQTYTSVEEMLYDLNSLIGVNDILNYNEYLTRTSDNTAGEGNDSEEEILTDINYDSGATEDEPIDFGEMDDETPTENKDAEDNKSRLGGVAGKTFSIDNDEELMREKSSTLNTDDTPVGNEWSELESELKDMKSQLGEDGGLEFDNDEDTDNRTTGGLDDNGRPVCVNSNEQILGMLDKISRIISLNSEASKNNTVKLNNENSIDCTKCHSGAKNWRDSFLLKTPKGQDRMSTLLWKDILGTIESNGFKGAIVTRLSIHGNQMYINGKLINLNGIVGGPQAVRLQDIVQFRTTLNKFKYIREIRIDDTILDSLLLELGPNGVEQLFKIEKSLVYLIDEHSDGNYTKVTREDVESQRNEKAMAAMKSKAADRQGRMAFDAECKARNADKRGTMGASYDISMNKLAKASFGQASEHLMKSSKPSLVRGIGWGALGLTTGAIAIAGGVIGGGFNAIKGLTNIGR